MMTSLRKATCRECRSAILVAPYLPHPDQEYTTGMPAHRWDYDRSEEHFVGYVCEKCAFALVGEGKPGSISGPDLEFHY